MSWMKKRTMGGRCSRLYRQDELVCSPVLDSRLGHIGHREEVWPTFSLISCPRCRITNMWLDRRTNRSRNLWEPRRETAAS
jgi:hypothetical protein